MFHQAHLVAALLLATAAPAPFAPVSDKDFDAKVLQPHRGKIVVVNFWASYCAPCIDEIPVFQNVLAKDKDVALVFVSADPRSSESRALKIVEQKKLKLSSFIVENDDPEPFINAIDPQWAGQVPYTVIYGRDGKRLQSLEGEQTALQLGVAIQAAKAAAPGPAKGGG